MAILLSPLCAGSIAFCAEPMAIPAKAPPLGGFWLGQPMADASVRLGAGSSEAALGAATPWAGVLESEDRSLSLVATQDQGVTMIILRKRDANGLLGVHVGDACGAPQTAWGKSAAHESNGLWNFGAWIAQVHCDDGGKIDRLTIGL